MEALLPLIIQAVSGAAGGGIVGSLVKQVGMSLLPKLLAGGVGGLLGGAAASGAGPIADLLGMASQAGSGGMLDGIIGQVAGGAVGGGALTGIGGLLAGMMKK
jgi:hypothetical protein